MPPLRVALSCQRGFATWLDPRGGWAGRSPVLGALRTIVAAGLADGLAALLAATAGAFVVALLGGVPGIASAGAAPPAPPARLSATGLFAAHRPGQVADGAAAFTPLYPLWTDGAAKRRWLALPPGSTIDASDPDAWQFPPGTRLWKEFAFAGRPVETRLVERLVDGSWRFAAYVWDADGRDATLAPAVGAVLAVPAAPGGRYVVPSRDDCLACHGSAAVPVLGAGTLQLSPARDAHAPGGRTRSAGELDLLALAGRGWLRGLPPALLEQPPRLAARTPLERAALGAMMGNCAHCHNASANRVPVRLDLAPSVAEPQAALQRVLTSLLDAPSRWQAAPGESAATVVPGDAAASVLVRRMASREPRVQMPPLGTAAPDHEALALLARWIDEELPRLPPAADPLQAALPPRLSPRAAVRLSHPEENPR